MRILEVITLTELGGAQSVVANLANELTERGHEVIVAGGEGDGKMFELLRPEVRRERVKGLRRSIAPVDEVRALWELRRLWRRYRPDVVQLHSSKAGLLGRVAFPSKRVVYTVHGFDSIRLAYRKFLPLERLMQRRCAAIAGVSRYDEVHMREEGLTRNVSFVYNGIPEPPRTLKNDPFEDLREQFAGGVVLCIARLAYPKNHELFLETARRMPDTAFVWIGNQERPDFDVPGNCRFAGNILNAGEYCRYADVFYLPSNYEGLPIVILEAMACGCPVVASKVGGIPEMLDGRNGFAVENRVEEAVEAIGKVMARREEFATAARATYERNFTVGRMADGYLRIFDLLVEGYCY